MKNVLLKFMSSLRDPMQKQIWGIVVHLSLTTLPKKKQENLLVLYGTKLVSYVRCRTHFKCSRQSKLKNEHLESFRAVNLAFWSHF